MLTSPSPLARETDGIPGFHLAPLSPAGEGLVSFRSSCFAADLQYGEGIISPCTAQVLLELIRVMPFYSSCSHPLSALGTIDSSLKTSATPEKNFHRPCIPKILPTLASWHFF
jgi:hypothetical protein